MVWGRGHVGCIGVCALLLGLWPRLRVWHLVCKDKPHLGLWGKRRQMLKAHGWVCHHQEPFPRGQGGGEERTYWEPFPRVEIPSKS